MFNQWLLVYSNNFYYRYILSTQILWYNRPISCLNIAHPNSFIQNQKKTGKDNDQLNPNSGSKLKIDGYLQ